MAIWQFSFMIVPTEWAETNENITNRSLTIDGCWDLTSSWAESASRTAPEDIIDQILPRTTSWSPDLTLWCQTTSDSDIHLWREAGKIVELEIRIDVRKKFHEMLEHSVAIARQLNCSFFLMETGTIVKPSIELLGLEMLNSRAVRYLKDPNGTLSEQY